MFHEVVESRSKFKTLKIDILFDTFISQFNFIFKKNALKFPEKLYGIANEISEMNSRNLLFRRTAPDFVFQEKSLVFFKEFEVNLQSPWISVFLPLTFIVRFFSNFSS